MHLYMAAMHTSNFGISSPSFNSLNDNEKWQRLQGQRHVLESYHYVYKASSVAMLRRDNVKVFLDSGAFSAYTQGVDIDIKAYCRYIQDNADIIKVEDGILLASVLDGIGDPEKTLHNQNTMEKLGVKPLPCYHYGEDESYLEHYIKNYEYITIGGMVPIHRNQLFYWLDRLWDRHLTDGSGRPRLKVHAFGINHVPLIERYPWYSADASSWVHYSRNGNVVFLDENDRMIYLPISADKEVRKVHGQHYDTLEPVHKAEIKRLLELNGCDVERLRTNYLSRGALCIYTLSRLSDVYNKRTHTFKPERLELF